LRGGKVTEVSELNCLKGRLRPLDESKLVPSTYLTFEYLSGKMMENHVDGLLLDDGCGSHNFKAFLEGRADAEVFGVDVRVDHYAYYPVNVIADSERLPIKSGSMDSVSSNFVLEHTVQPAVYLSEVRRVLKKGSVAFVSVPTPYYHLAYFFCLEGWVKYLLQVVNNPVKFLRNPAKHFLVGRAHEKEWSVDSRENVTFLDEIRRWRTKNWEKLFDKSNLNVVEEKVTGNPLSLNRGLSKKLGNSKEYGVHRTYTLR
jgi:ubiquinone/menaquinone biosynthesis C-methylase UbiE